MEILSYTYEAGGTKASAAKPVLVGVVGSGNLEVLVEPADLKGACAVEITTAAVGFGNIWRAVIDDFFDRWKPADLRISVNDVGATPAVVSLRLDQAMEAVQGENR